MKRPMLRKIGKKARVAEATMMAVMALVVTAAAMASAKKKEKVVLPDYVLKAKTLLVVILPDAGEPTDDPSANRKSPERAYQQVAQVEVEKAFMKWGRFQLTLDADLADLVIGVRKGTNATVNDAIRVGVMKGRPTDATQPPQPGGPLGTNVIGGPTTDDMFKVFQGKVQHPLDFAPVWRYTEKDGLKPPEVTAVAEFRKAVEESEKAAAQKQQQQKQGQSKTP